MSTNIDDIKGKVTLIAHITAKPGKAEEVKALLVAARDSAVSDKEPDVYTYRINQFGDEFGIFEEYKDSATVKAHMALPPFQALSAKKDEVIDKLSIQVYNEL